MTAIHHIFVVYGGHCPPGVSDSLRLSLCHLSTWHANKIKNRVLSCGRANHNAVEICIMVALIMTVTIKLTGVLVLLVSLQDYPIQDPTLVLKVGILMDITGATDIMKQVKNQFTQNYKNHVLMT